MKRRLLTISYDGTNYHGWQVQPNGITVQQTIQDSLEKMLGFRPALAGCSRTDAGVHAREFCCHFNCEDNYPNIMFVKGLNSFLPSDIAVKSCVDVAEDFHARYNARGKTYVYNIYNSNVKDPFRLRYAWQIERKLDENKMNLFCKNIVGKHDFYAFSSSGRSVTDTVRTIYECSAIRNGDDISISVTGDGFLYNMVRIIVGTAVSVSDGKIQPEDAEKILNSKDRSLAGVTAPPNGLFLEKVLY